MQPDVGPSLLMCYMHVSTYVYIATEGRKLRAVAHLAFARSQKTEAGISGLTQESCLISEIWAARDRCLFQY